VDLRTADLHRIDNANNGGVDRTLFAAKGHSGRAALYDQDQLVNACTDSVYGNKMTLFIFTINTHKSRDKQLPTVKAIILTGGDDGSNYASKNHDGRWETMNR